MIVIRKYNEDGNKMETIKWFSKIEYEYNTSM